MKSNQGPIFHFSDHLISQLTKVVVVTTEAFDCVDHNKLWKILRQMGIPDHLACLWEICMQVRKQQLELDMEQQTGSK